MRKRVSLSVQEQRCPDVPVLRHLVQESAGLGVNTLIRIDGPHRPPPFRGEVINIASGEEIITVEGMNHKLVRVAINAVSDLLNHTETIVSTRLN